MEPPRHRRSNPPADFADDFEVKANARGGQGDAGRFGERLAGPKSCRPEARDQRRAAQRKPARCRITPKRSAASGMLAYTGGLTRRQAWFVR